MQDLYITRPGKLSIKDGTFLFTFKESGELRKISAPVEMVNAINIFAPTTITYAVFREASERKIPIYIFNSHMRLISIVSPPTLKNGKVLLKQFQKFSKERLQLAKLLVLGSIANMRWVLAKKKLPFPENLSQQVKAAMTIDQLYSAEGKAWEVFYMQLDFLLPAGWKIENREYRPPTNRANIVISYLNVLLYSRLNTMIMKSPLDPAISVLHSPFQRRISLALDIAEIFKPLVTFGILLKNAALKSFPAGMFDGLLLTPEGKRFLIKEFEDYLARTYHSKKLGRKVSFEEIMRAEVYKLVRYLLDDESYKPFTPWW